MTHSLNHPAYYLSTHSTSLQCPVSFIHVGLSLDAIAKDIDSCTHLLCSLQSVFLVFVLLRLRVLLVLDPWHWCDSSPVRQTRSSDTTSRNLKYPCPDYSPDSSCSSCCVFKINLHTNISVSWYTSVTLSV